MTKPCANCGKPTRVAAGKLFLVLLHKDADNPRRKGQYWCANCTADDGFETVAQAWAC